MLSVKVASHETTPTYPSDTLASTINIRGRQHKPISHDVLFDQMQILLAARVISNMLGSIELERHERLAQALTRIADMLRSANNQTNIKRSDTLRAWAEKCGGGVPPKTKCVAALDGVFESLDGEGFSGSPTEDWLKVRRLVTHLAVYKVLSHFAAL